MPLIDWTARNRLSPLTIVHSSVYLAPIMPSRSCTLCECNAFAKADGKVCNCGHTKKEHRKGSGTSAAAAQPPELSVSERLAIARTQASKDVSIATAPGLPFALSSQPRNLEVRPSVSYSLAYTEAKSGLKSTSQSGRYEKQAKGRARAVPKNQSGKASQAPTARKRSPSKAPSTAQRKSSKGQGKVLCLITVLRPLLKRNGKG